MDLNGLDEVGDDSVGGQRTQVSDRCGCAGVRWSASTPLRGSGRRGSADDGSAAYSPELNPAERVYEEVRRWVEGRTYVSIEAKIEAASASL